MEQQPDIGRNQTWDDRIAKVAKKYNNANYDNFHENHPHISTFITLCFHFIGFGVLFLLHSAKNGADEVYTGFAEIVIYIFNTVRILYNTIAEPVYSLRVDHTVNPACMMHECW